MTVDIDKAFATARKISSEKKCDIFLYNGDISRSYVLDFIELIHANKEHDEAVLILVTKGGDPDAGYKISRYIQSRYASHTRYKRHRINSHGRKGCDGFDHWYLCSNVLAHRSLRRGRQGKSHAYCQRLR